MRKIILLLLLCHLFSNCGASSGGECESYSEWKPTSEKCDSNFWCFFNGQKATYQYYERSRQCKNGVVKDTKKDKIRCGCN